jgi:hypothetical protein
VPNRLWVVVLFGDPLSSLGYRSNWRLQKSEEAPPPPWVANRSSSTKSNSTRLIVRAQCLNAFSQIDKGDMTLQHLTTEVLPESITSLQDRVFPELKA